MIKTSRRSILLLDVFFEDIKGYSPTRVNTDRDVAAAIVMLNYVSQCGLGVSPSGATGVSDALERHPQGQGVWNVPLQTQMLNLYLKPHNTVEGLDKFSR